MNEQFNNFKKNNEKIKNIFSILKKKLNSKSSSFISLPKN